MKSSNGTLKPLTQTNRIEAMDAVIKPARDLQRIEGRAIGRGATASRANSC